MIVVALAAALIAQTAPVSPAPAVVCPLKPSFPAGFAAWGAAASPATNAFVVGRATDIPAIKLDNVRLAVQPSKPVTDGYVASATFEIAGSGTYGVAVGGAKTKAKLWLDIAGADRKPLESTAHTHGGDCNSITKIVDFKLAPGRYTLLVTGLEKGDQAIRALVVRR